MQVHQQQHQHRRHRSTPIGNVPHSTPLERLKSRLSVHALTTAEQRSMISHLREYSASTLEYELDPGSAQLESTKDEIGLVFAITLGWQTIATLRVIPVGHGLTLTERLWRDAAIEAQILHPGSWEVGRLVLAPEHRRADLLPRCLAMVLRQFMNVVDAQHLHATCLTSMSRLYRRFGFAVGGFTESSSGERLALIHGRVSDVASALRAHHPTTPVVQDGPIQKYGEIGSKRLNSLPNGLFQENQMSNYMNCQI